MKDNKDPEVIILGGSYAGLSAAMALGRSLRRVLIIDSGLPCNRQTPHSHNFLTQDGEQPAEIARKAKEQVLSYPTVHLLEETAVKGEKTQNGFLITTASGQRFTAKKLIIATGIKDLLPDLKGFAECWGISVVHCPYCHGYELGGGPVGVIAAGPNSLHQAELLTEWGEVTFLVNGALQLDEHQRIEPEIRQLVFHHNIRKRAAGNGRDDLPDPQRIVVTLRFGDRFGLILRTLLEQLQHFDDLGPLHLSGRSSR